MTPTVILYEDWCWHRFLPLTYVRPTFELVCGSSSLLDRVRRADDGGRPGVDGVWCREVLAALVAERSGLPVNMGPETNGALYLNGRGIWHGRPAVAGDEGPWVGMHGDSIACIRADAELVAKLVPETLLDETRTRVALAALPRRDVGEHVTLFEWPWNLVLANPAAIVDDWRLRRSSAGIHGRIHDGSHLLAAENVHIGERTTVKPCVVIDAEEGPVWIDEDVRIMPHSYVQGPAVIGRGTLLQPGAIVRAGTTIGPYCKIGGEVEGSIVHGFSNKQHDGFLGHGYVAEWVNVAADCVNSDLKNTYGTVRVPINGRRVDTGEMFVGLLVGDHSKIGINVSFPTGSVVGFCSSVFAARSPQFVPSFTWIDDTIVRYSERRGLDLAKRVMARRQRSMSPGEEAAFRSVRRQALAIELEPQQQIDEGEGD